MEYKRLYRSNKDSMIAGVCGGLGEYFNLDPTIVRLITILLLFVTGLFPVLIIYIILSVVIPKNPNPAA
ncbi:MAG: PspC domain-containing protein [Chloroflexia bacterium]